MNQTQFGLRKFKVPHAPLGVETDHFAGSPPSVSARLATIAPVPKKKPIERWFHELEADYGESKPVARRPAPMTADDLR